MRDIGLNFGAVTIALILINVAVFFAVQVPDTTGYYDLDWGKDCSPCKQEPNAIYQGEYYICPESAETRGGYDIDYCQKLPGNCCQWTRTDRLSLIPKYAFQEPWLFITSMFMHADMGHLLGNMLFLFLLGGIAENMMGRRDYIIMYFAAGIFGGIVMIFMAQMGVIGDTTPVLGASGAIFGVVAAAALFKPWDIIYMYYVPMPLILLGIIFLGKEIYYISIGGEAGVANGAHLGGAIIGIIFAIYYLKFKEKKRKVVYRYGRDY